MFNCGMMAVQLEEKIIDKIFNNCAGKETLVKTDLENKIFTVSTDDFSDKIAFNISNFDFALVKAGGWVAYADQKY